MIFVPEWQLTWKKWRYGFKPTKEVPIYHTISLQVPSEYEAATCVVRAGKCRSGTFRAHHRVDCKRSVGRGAECYRCLWTLQHGERRRLLPDWSRSRSPHIRSYRHRLLLWTGAVMFVLLHVFTESEQISDPLLGTLTLWCSLLPYRYYSYKASCATLG